jgi:hypothetical protein
MADKRDFKVFAESGTFQLGMTEKQIKLFIAECVAAVMTKIISNMDLLAVSHNLLIDYLEYKGLFNNEDYRKYVEAREAEPKVDGKPVN